MRLVVDASVLVGEALRARGRRRLGDPRLDLYLPERTRGEAMHEIPRRAKHVARQRRFSDRRHRVLLDRSTRVVDRNCRFVAETVYAVWEAEARRRIPRDPSDWPVVACALAMEAAIWTADNDFLGVGIPTWTTETLDAQLEWSSQARTPPRTPRPCEVAEAAESDC